MRKIAIGFSTSTKFSIFSRLIRWAENAPFSHVYIKTFDEEIKEPVYFQASHTYVNCMTPKIFLEQELVIEEYEFEISEQAYRRMKRFAMDNVGKPYGVMAIFGLAYVQIMAWLGKRVKNPCHKAGKTWICSQFAAAALDDVNNSLIPCDINDVTPRTMYDLVKTLPKNLCERPGEPQAQQAM